jgi:thiamine monophosphate synthase
MDPDTTLGANLRDQGKEKACQMETGEAVAAPLAARRPSRLRNGDRVEDLPPPGITRWVIRRKAQVVAAVRSGVITLEDVCQRYSVSVEEFQSWQKALERHGLYGLRTTRSQIYRAEENSPSSKRSAK